MNKFLCVATALVACSGTMTATAAPEDFASVEAIRSMSVQEVHARLAQREDNRLLLDVRTPEEFASGHIAGALNIPVDDLPVRLEEIAGYRSAPVIVYCRSGRRSLVASQILVKAGFRDVTNMTGGVLDWSAAGFPLVK